MTSTPYYDHHAPRLTEQYEALSSAKVHEWLVDLLTKSKGLALDVGAGSGRDASWLASLGFDVIAVEPSSGMRAEAKRLHPETNIQWINDSLPDFQITQRLGLSFDFILLSAVWMHLPTADRPRAFRKLMNLLKPGGLLAITLRIGPAAQERAMFAVSEQEIEALAKDHGAYIEKRVIKQDEGGRAEVSWIQLAIRLPDDGTGALPLLRHIILNDDKSSTYKLALIRCLCRIADGASGYARNGIDDTAELPLGLVALYWIRLYLPLLKAELPQQPRNLGLDGLGFVKDGFRKLAEHGNETSHLDLRVGMRFTDARGEALHAALRDACKTIQEMPARYLTYPDGRSIVAVKRNTRVPIETEITLDEAYLSSFGFLRLPRHLFTALQRFDAWIEPAIVSEWLRLIKNYGLSQNKIIQDQTLSQALQWSNPERDVSIARGRALQLMKETGLWCVYSGKKLSPQTIDIDHCLPWHAWPCSDLWNLVPAHSRVNRYEKRERLPSDMVMVAAREQMQEWWRTAYVQDPKNVRGNQFFTQAQASLPMLNTKPGLQDVFTALQVQRMRLKFDQGVPEWTFKRMNDL